MIATINQILLPLETFIKKYRNFIGYFILFLSFCSVYYMFDERSVKESGEKSLLILWIILWIPIIARVIGLKIATHLLPLRKELGILMWVLALVHSSRFLISNPDYIWTLDFWYFDWQINYLAFWFFAALLTFPLLLTSNLYSIKRMGKWWKRLHRCVYIIAILTIIHVVLLKWSIHFEFGPIVIFIFYSIGKILEWKWFSFLKSEAFIVGKKWQKYLCVPCGYIYDPTIWDEDSGIPPGTEFWDIPESWRCPVCGVTKSDFIPYNDDEDIVKQNATIVEKNFLNPTTIELIVETEKDIRSIPWQFMSFAWKDEEWSFSRQYSIVEQKWRFFTFTIKLSDSGRGATLLRKIPLHAKIWFNWVFGSFRLKDTKKTKIFISTGTGLAPIYNMASSLDSSIQAKLYFSVATKSDLFYEEKLKALPNIELHICTTREEVEWCEFGRVDIDTIEADNDAEWYLCGNPRMVSEAKEKLSNRWFTQVYSEEF